MSMNCAAVMGASPSVRVHSWHPELTVRHVQGTSPVRFVFSRNPAVGAGTKFRVTSGSVRSIVICTAGVPGTKERDAEGVEIWCVGSDRLSGIDIFLDMVQEAHIGSVLLEGGAALAGSFLEAQRVNRLHLYYGNCILGGGRDGLSLVHPRLMADAIRLTSSESCSFGDTHMVTGLLHRSDEKGVAHVHRAD